MEKKKMKKTPKSLISLCKRKKQLEDTGLQECSE